jgi:hypothetical protein
MSKRERFFIKQVKVPLGTRLIASQITSWKCADGKFRSFLELILATKGSWSSSLAAEDDQSWQ